MFLFVFCPHDLAIINPARIENRKFDDLEVRGEVEVSRRDQSGGRAAEDERGARATGKLEEAAEER